MNEKVIVLTRYRGSILYMSTDGRRPLEYQLFCADDNEIVGNIYVCRIKDVIRNIGSSFVSYAEGRTGFLKSTKYKQGQLVALQLKKQGDKDKAPVFTDVISISGAYTVLTEANKEFSISRKITGNKRKELRDKYMCFFSDLEYGITLRTNGANAAMSDVLREADEIAGVIGSIREHADKRTYGTVLYRQENEWIKYCYKSDIVCLEKIITDDIEIYSALMYTVFPKINKINENIKLELYDDSMLSLDKLYSVETGLNDALSKKVWLGCGGYLYIEQTEALTSIDVNTGKLSKGKDREETFFKCNMEAAEEIARQLRLRNLSGIIIIDFINMTDKDNLSALTRRLKELFLNDSVKTVFHDVTALSLVEITRQKQRECLREQLQSIDMISEAGNV